MTPEAAEAVPVPEEAIVVAHAANVALRPSAPHVPLGSGSDRSSEGDVAAVEADAAVLRPSAVPDGRRCGACGRDNDRRRELCAVCGADLETGLGPEPSPGPDRRLGRRDLAERRERAVLAVVGVLVVIAAAVTPLLMLGIGPFAPAERLEPALLLRAAYPSDPVVLVVGTVASTTTATAPDRDLSPLNLIDGDGVTAWVGLPTDDVAGEVIQFVLEQPAWVVRVQIRNGDHLSPDAYEASGRLQRGLLSFDGGRDHRIDLLDIGRQAQLIELLEPELTTRVTIRVDRIFPGSASRGVALSEVTLLGWPADVSDAALARQRAQWP